MGIGRHFKKQIWSLKQPQNRIRLALLAFSTLTLAFFSCARPGASLKVQGIATSALSPTKNVTSVGKPRKFLSHEDRVGSSPEVLLGQRLFRETRFGQYFALHSKGNVNAVLTTEEEIMRTIPTTRGAVKSPYAGLGGINCASCHFVDEARSPWGAGSRSYTDFLPRSFIPVREDSRIAFAEGGTTLRNSLSMVNATAYDGRQKLFHSDGQYGSLPELVEATFVGRNFGWQPGEEKAARAQLLKVIREDDGNGPIAKDFGKEGPSTYREIFAGEAASIDETVRLAKEHRLDVMQASDDQVVKAVSAMVVAFIDSLRFSVDDSNQYDGTPYDAFLIKNELPRSPSKGESDRAYAARLLREVRKHQSQNDLKFVSPNEKSFHYQDQDYVFSETELKGLTLFLNPDHSANCVHCHAPPHFTDFSFHNTGISQVEFDGLHGAGSFMKLRVPTLAERQKRPEYLPASAQHPNAQGLFAQIPSEANPDIADLGAWNVFANPDAALAQDAMTKILCASVREQKTHASCETEALLNASLARMKTPSLRNLSMQNPYMHNGEFATIDLAVASYQKASELARAGKLRNGDPAVAEIHLDDNAVISLSAFLKSLNEDYH